MKRILFIVLLFIVCISGCFAQERGMFVADFMEFDSTSQTTGRVMIEISPTKNEVTWNFGHAKKKKTFYLENVCQIIGHDCIVKGRATNMDQIRLYYTDGLLVGGLITKKVFVPRTGRCREVTTEFTRQTLTSK